MEKINKRNLSEERVKLNSNLAKAQSIEDSIIHEKLKNSKSLVF